MFNLKLFLFITLFSISLALPVIEKRESEPPGNQINQPQQEEEWELGLEYERYLKEVVQALESDPVFRKKLETANVEDIKSGKIAQDLHLVDHSVRTKLDELKRGELERLRHLAIREHEKKTGVDRTRLKIPVHIDHRNPARFESEDLRKLISQLNRDLEKVDKEREEEFKRYELEKEYKYKNELDGMNDEQRQQLMAKHEERQKKHRDHPKLHHPGSKQQLEEVWEEQDRMNAEDFDPKTFFHLHDLDGNGYWDENEVKTLFQKELDKMYDPNNPEDDLTERYEEMERMRAHVFGETDLDRDNLISFDEFVEQTKKNSFERDEGWQGLDEQESFSQQEYEAYRLKREAELQRLIESGAIPPPPGYHGMNPPQRLVLDDSHLSGNAIPYGGPPVPAGMVGNAPHFGSREHPQGYQQVPQGYQQVPQGYQQVPQGYQQVPSGYQQMPPQGLHQQIPPQGYQVPPQGHQQVPVGYQQVPQGYQQVPQGYQHIPQNYQQVPQGYQQIPQGYQAQPQGKAVPQEAVKSQQRSAAPQAQSLPQPPQAVPQSQAAPQPISQSQAQAVPQPAPQAQVVPPDQAPAKQVPDAQGQQRQFQQPPGVVLQNQQENLNQPDLKPLDNNKIT